MRKKKVMSTIAALVLCTIMSTPVAAATNINNNSLVSISGTVKQPNDLEVKRESAWYSNDENVFEDAAETPSISRKSLTLSKGKRYTLTRRE